MNWEKYFPLGKMEWTHWEFCQKNVWSKGPDWRFSFLAYLRAGNTFSKQKWGYELQNFLVAVALDPLASYLHTAWNESHFASSQGLALLGFFPYTISFPNQWSIEMFYLYDDKVLILKCSLFFRATNTEIWSKERSMGPYVAKTFFLPVDEGFWLYWRLIQKYLAKLTLCFSILLL